MSKRIQANHTRISWAIYLYFISKITFNNICLLMTNKINKYLSIDYSNIINLMTVKQNRITNIAFDTNSLYLFQHNKKQKMKIKFVFNIEDNTYQLK